MALDNWFQNWQPPSFQQLFHEPVKNYSNDHYHYDKKTSDPLKLLPLLLSFNFLKPFEDKSNQGPYIQSNSKKKSKPILNNDLPFIRTPLDSSSNREKSANKKQISQSDFGTPPRQELTSYSVTENHKATLDATEHPDNKYKYEPHANYRVPLKDPDDNSFPELFGKRQNSNATFEDANNLKPLEVTGTFKTWYRWKMLDFKYPTDLKRSEAIAKGEFIPENNLPLGIEVYKNRIFLSMPKWKEGVPATLAHLPRIPIEESPQLVPYPSWDWHSEKSCDLITSVFRMYADECGRLWVLDSGKISITTEEAKQHCPPKLLIFDLETDQLLEKYVFPDTFIKEDGLYSNIIVDIRDGDCHDAYAYMTDVWRFGIVVFRLIDQHAWRVTDRLFFPDPLAASYKLHNLRFVWTDGIFGISLSPSYFNNEDRIMYFHPMSSFREFYVKSSYIRTEERENDDDAIKVMGESRGPSGHASSSVMDNNGIMYYNLVTRDSVGCWDSRKPYKRENLGIIAKSTKTLVFPNDMKLDKEKRQSIWVVSNRLPYYLLEGLNSNEINFRVMSAYTDESIKGTICDPDVHSKTTFVSIKEEIDCY